MDTTRPWNYLTDRRAPNYAISPLNAGAALWNSLREFQANICLRARRISVQLSRFVVRVSRDGASTRDRASADESLGRAMMPANCFQASEMSLIRF
jgi:hypothetical protein